MPSTSRPQNTTSTSAELALMLLGPSVPMSKLWAQIRRLAPYARTVLLAGSPESGQEAVARLLLDLSPWPQRPFLALRERDAEERLVRAGALSTFPNEVFLFLPEVDRLSPDAQQALLKLMRARRSRAFTVVAASAEDLKALVGVGRFSAELADALGTLRVQVPSLKDRAEDLPMLLSQAISMRCQATDRPAPQLAEGILRAAMSHSWPGNLHELAEMADHLLAHNDPGQELGAADFHRALSHVKGDRPFATPVRLVKLDTVVQEHISSVLRACRGNKLRAAEILGISRSTLYRMLDAAGQGTSLPLAS